MHAHNINDYTSIIHTKLLENVILCMYIGYNVKYYIIYLYYINSY